MTAHLSSAEWHATLPTFVASAAAVITDPAGAVLLVKPNYREGWNLPGGVMEADEPPHLCCAREVTEELGLTLPIGPPLVIDWSPPTEIRKGWFGFLFDGGTLADLSGVRLQAEELDDVAFVPPAEAPAMLPAIASRRLAAALRVRGTGATAYLTDGVPVSPTTADYFGS